MFSSLSRSSEMPESFVYKVLGDQMRRYSTDKASLPICWKQLGDKCWELSLRCKQAGIIGSAPHPFRKSPW